MPREKRFYRVKAATSPDGETRPDIPEGINWVGNTDGKFYLICAREDLGAGADVEKLNPRGARRMAKDDIGLREEDPEERWGVSE